MLPVTSEIAACITGKTAPPSMAITSPEPAILVSSPNPSTASPKMVGNISDKNAETIMRAITPVIPAVKIAVNKDTIPAIAAIPKIFDGRKYFIIPVAIKRPAVNKTSDKI